MRQVPPDKFAARRVAAVVALCYVGTWQKGVAQSVLSLSVRQCWHAHPELSFDTCKWLCKEFNRTLTTLSGEAPWRPWALPVRRKSLTVVREFLHLAYVRLSLRATFSI